MNAQLGNIGDELLDKYQHEVVQTFTNYCINEQYNTSNISEDIEELSNSMIYEYMQIQLHWNDRQAVDFIHTLQNTLKLTNKNCNDTFANACDSKSNISNTNIHTSKMKDLLNQIKIRDKLSVFGFVRNHCKTHNINFPIPIIHYCIIYSFELKTAQLNSIINHKLMASSYKSYTIDVFFNFCIEQEYFEKTNILEDIKEIDESFIVEHMELQCNWTSIECMTFVNLLNLIITGENMDHTKNIKSVGFGVIPPQMFQVIMNGYLPKHYDI